MGVGGTEFDPRVRIGSLHRVHRGVYRLGHDAPSALASYMAATKACGAGSGSVVSRAHTFLVCSATSPK